MSDPWRIDVKFPRWDHSLPKSILSDYELRCLPHGISSYLHYCTNTTPCGPHDLCAMCGNAVRLVIQQAEPKILEAASKKMRRAIGLGCD